MSINPQSVINFLVREIMEQRRHLFLWSPVFMAFGIVIFFNMTINVTWSVVLPFLVILILISAISVHFYSKTGQMRWLIVTLIGAALVLPVIGYGIAKLRTERIQTIMLEKDLSSRLIEGDIEKIILMNGGKAKRVILSNVIINDQSLRVRLKSYHFKGDNWRFGDRVSVQAALMAPSGPVMPDGFDFGLKAFYEGISAVGYTTGSATLLQRQTETAGQLAMIRARIAQSLYDTMTPRYAGVAQALLTGERAGINEDDSEAFRVSGLAHLLAISGLHIGLVAGCVFFFIRLGLAVIPAVALRYPIKKWAACCAILVAFAYMLLAGATVPTVRAFIMTSLVLLAVIMDRSALNMRLVALAALFVMITTPEAVIGPSFVLSFSAVAALIVFYRDIGRKWLTNANAYHPLWRPIYYLFGIIITSLVATAATAPFSIMYFNRFAVYSVLSNILAMPLMAFIVMPFGLLATLLIPVGWDDHFWVMMEWGIAQILVIAGSVAAYDYASIPFPSFGSYETFLICFGFLWFLLWGGYLRVIGLICIVTAFILSAQSPAKMVMISDDMRAILYVDKSEDNLYLIGRMNSYLRSNWLGYHGYLPNVDIPSYNNGDKSPSLDFRCDDKRCIVYHDTTRLSIIHNPIILQDACMDSNIVIARIPIEDQLCNAEKIIDRFDIWRQGATTITFNDNEYHVEVVNE